MTLEIFERYAPRNMQCSIRTQRFLSVLIRATLGARAGVLPDAVRERSNRGAVEQEEKKRGDRRFVHGVACADAKRQNHHNKKEPFFNVSNIHLIARGATKTTCRTTDNAVGGVRLASIDARAWVMPVDHDSPLDKTQLQNRKGLETQLTASLIRGAFHTLR